MFLQNFSCSDLFLSIFFCHIFSSALSLCFKNVVALFGRLYGTKILRFKKFYPASHCNIQKNNRRWMLIQSTVPWRGTYDLYLILQDCIFYRRLIICDMWWRLIQSAVLLGIETCDPDFIVWDCVSHVKLVVEVDSKRCLPWH